MHLPNRSSQLRVSHSRVFLKIRQCAIFLSVSEMINIESMAMSRWCLHVSSARLPLQSMSKPEDKHVFLKKRHQTTTNTSEGDPLKQPDDEIRINDSHQQVKSDSSNNPLNLLHFNDMPQHLQFNPYILTGYRPLSNAWGCVSSMWKLHNETINIITHGRFS